MRKIYKIVNKATHIPYNNYVSELSKLLEGCDSVLDIGCGEQSPLDHIDIKYCIAFDEHKSSLDKAKKRKTYHKYVKGNALSLSKYFKPKSVDCCIGLDIIEHLSKKEGHKMIKAMEKIARKKVILFTPNGFLSQYNTENKLLEHISGWKAKEFKKLNFKVIGIFGLKSLRGGMHLLKYRPKILWGAISELSNIFYTRNHPEKAAAVLCVKEL